MVKMEEDKEKWVEETLGSLEGFKRAIPAADLFARIESKVNETSTRVVTISQWRPAVAAALLLLVLNIFAIRLYTQAASSVDRALSVNDVYETQLISDFKLYDE
jgi:hypothetical protein